MQQLETMCDVGGMVCRCKPPDGQPGINCTAAIHTIAHAHQTLQRNKIGSATPKYVEQNRNMCSRLESNQRPPAVQGLLSVLNERSNH